MATGNNTNELSFASIDYDKTGYFSSLVIDYLSKSPMLKAFYSFPPDLAGLKEAVAIRKNFPCNREVLISVLKEQYLGLPVSDRLRHNIEALSNKNCFTITTAHQPNIFTGPLYFVYKIIHTVRLASVMNNEMKDHYFVPVFYMGSEDADLEELGHITVDGVLYQWKTKQTGTVGRMKVDDDFIALIGQMQGQLGVLPFGNDLMALFRSAYSKGKTIQQATLELVNTLFSEWGVIVINPDNAKLKKTFEPVVKRELNEAFSHRAVSETIANFPTQYKVQASGRQINLFYLLNDRRERIEWENDRFVVKAMGLEFTAESIQKEVEEFPDRFSGNVILRGVFQETILPNVAFIGGGGELAYWLELKQVFKEAGKFFPVLILRNSFMLIDQKCMQEIGSLNLALEELFLPEAEILRRLVLAKNKSGLSISTETSQIKTIYDLLTEKASAIDFSLRDHVQALQKRCIDKLEGLEKKMIRAEKKKLQTEKRKLSNIKKHLFPGGSLQERVENFSSFYARYGNKFLDVVLKNSPSYESKFTIIRLEDIHDE